ncbi:MAG: cytochrome C oxidase subunit IV family protein [Pirellulaceae bacterium]|nr:cytochrome C oxidase subunit IV family protein [Pirellulaceae bacterium]
MSENQSDHANAEHEHEHEEHHGGYKTYIAVFVGLIVLTILSFWIGNSDIKNQSPAAAWAGMMAVSCAKAMLVILFFMHLKWEANWKYVLTIPAMIMSIFLVCMLIPDVGMRTLRYSEERMVHAAHPVTHDDHGDDHGDDQQDEHHDGETH